VKGELRKLLECWNVGMCYDRTPSTPVSLKKVEEVIFNQPSSPASAFRQGTALPSAL
jgi:hypothetical protein